MNHLTINSLPSIAAAQKVIADLYAKHKYITLTYRIGADRSLDQNALLHVWLTEYAAFLLKKDKRQVTEQELEGMKKIAKRNFYSETGAEWMVFRPLDPFTGQQGQLSLRSSKRYSRGEMFQFLSWFQMTAANDGLVLESKGEYAKLQREQTE